MGELHVAGGRDLDAVPDRSLQRRESGPESPLLGLQSQAGNAAVARLIQEGGTLGVQRSCGCSGGGCSCGGGGLQESEGAESQGEADSPAQASAAG